MIEEEEELYAPPTWKDIEASPQYQYLDNAKRRATFLKWDDQSRDFAQKSGLWEDKNFQTEYEKKSNDIVNGLTPWHEKDTGLRLARNAANSIMGGLLEGKRALEIQGNNDPFEVARLNKEIDKYKPSEEFSKTWNPDIPAAESWNSFKKDPVGNLTQLLTRSFASQTVATIGNIGQVPKRALQAGITELAATGVGMAASPGTAPAVAAAGAAGLPIALAGGAQWGYAEASTAASYASEYAGQYLETLQKHGVDVTDKESLSKAYQDKELMAKARADAQTKGVPVAAWDGISAVLADKFTGGVPGAKGAARALKMGGKWLAELGIQGFMGAAGDIHSQVALEGKVTDWKSPLAEFGAEFAQGAVDVGVAKATKLVTQDPATQAKAAAIQQTSQNLAANGAPITAQTFAKEGAENLIRQNAQTDEQLTEELFDEDEEGEVSPTDKTLGDEKFAPATSAIVESQKIEEPTKLEETVEFKPTEEEALAKPAPAVAAENLDTTEATLAPENTFDKLFAKLKTGDLTTNGKRDKMLGEAYLAFMNGDIPKATDLEAWINKRTEELKGTAPEAAPTTPEAKAEAKAKEPTRIQAFSFEPGQNVVIDDTQGATVHTVRDDGKIVVKYESAPGKTRFQAVNPVNTKVELIETKGTKPAELTAPDSAIEITQRLGNLPEEEADRISDLPLKDIPAAILAAEQQRGITSETTKPTTEAVTAPITKAAVEPATSVSARPVRTEPARPAVEPTRVSKGVKPTAEPATKAEAVSQPEPAKLTKLEAFVHANPNDDFGTIRDKWNAANKKKITYASVEKAVDSVIKKRPEGPQTKAEKPSTEVGKWKVEPGHRVSLNSKEAGQYKWAAFQYGSQGATAVGFDTKKEAEAHAKAQNEKAKNEAQEKATKEQAAETKPVEAAAEPVKAETAKEQGEKVKNEQQTTRATKPEDEPAKAEQAGRPEPAAKDERVADKTEEVKSNEETLHTAASVSIKGPEGATFIRTTDTDGRTAVEPIKQANTGANPFKEAGPFSKIEVGTKDSKGNFVPAKGDVTVTESVKKPTKREMAVTADTSPDPYQGEPLTNEDPLSEDDIEDSGIIKELDNIGALDEDATATSVLQNISQNKKVPTWARLLAGFLSKYVDDLQISTTYRPQSTWIALYDGNTGTMHINTARPYPAGVVFSILHEAAHHALLTKQNGKKKLNPIEQKALTELHSILEKLQSLEDFKKEYGITNIAELTSELLSNAGFREKLNSINLKGDRFNAFDRIVNTLARFLFGKQVSPGSMLEVAMRHTIDLAGEPVVETRPMSTKQDAQLWGENGGMLIAPLALPENETPKKTIKAYKLFARRADGKLYPLFIQKKVNVEGKKQAVAEPTEVGKWLKAESLPTKNFQKRPGWHSGVLPMAPHLRTKENLRAEDRVWAEVEVPADVDWQPIANASKKKDIRDRIPEGGFYQFTTSRQQGGGWIVSGAVRVNKLLSDTEITKVLTDAGFAEEAAAETRGALATAPTTPDIVVNGNANLEARTRAAVNLANMVAPLAPAKPEEVKALTSDQSKLVVDNLDIASKIANNFKNIPLTGFDERQSEARLGLIKAAQAYDPAKNDNFRNYSVRIIKNTLTDLFRKKVKQSRREVSANIALGEEGGETIQDTIKAVEGAPTPDQGAIDIINKVRESLSPRDQKILNDFSTGLPLRDVADMHGLSHEGVRKIIRRAGTEIMSALEAAGITDIDNIFPPTEQREPGKAKKPSAAEDEEAEVEAVGKLEAEDIKRKEPVEKVLSDAEDADNPGVYHFPDQTLVAPLAAWHGTKHKIADRKMSTSKIGTGEGTQAFGWGLYSAQRQGVAKGYQETAEGWVVDGETVIPRDNSVEAVALNNVANLGYEGALHGVQTNLDRHNKMEEKKVAAGIKTGKERDRTREGWEETIEEIKKLKGKEIKRNEGNLYKLDITPEDSDLLDWDKSVNDQSDKVKGILRELGVEVDKASHLTGEDVYRSNLKYETDPDPNADPNYSAIVLTEEQVSKKLEAAGIPGHKFLDRSSRHARTQEEINKDLKHAERDLASAKADLETQGLPENIRKMYADEVYRWELRVAKFKAEKPNKEGTHNYVMYDGKYIEILEENGKPVGTVAEAKPDQSLIAPLSPQAQPTKVPWGIQKQKGSYKPLGKLFSAGGRWSKELYTALKIKTQKARAAFVNSFMLDNKLKYLYKKHYPYGAIPRDTINKALGNIENYYTDAQWAEAKKIADPEEKAAFLLTAKLENFEKFRQEQAIALASLPNEIQDIIVEMREERNRLQDELRNTNSISDELRYSIDDSKDLYIHRTYDIFEDPKGKWVDWVLHSSDQEAQQIRTGATRIFTAKARAEVARQLMKDARAAGAPITKADALAQAQHIDVSSRVDELFTEYTEVADKGVMDIMKGRLEGQKSQAIIKMRGQIPAEIRALWGQRDDPAMNFAKTAGSLASFLANDEFLQTVLDDGLAKGYIWRKTPGQTRPKGFVPLIGPNAKSMAPMEGTYGPPMLRDAFAEMAKQNNEPDLITNLTGLVMKGKTVYSPQALVRNLLGNTLIIIANGNAFRGGSGKAVRTAWANTWKNASDKDKRAYIKRLTELGVIGDNVGQSILKELDHYSSLNDVEFENKLLNTAAKWAKSIDKGAQAMYGGVDDVWKIYAFEAEKGKLVKALGNTATTEEIESRAANIVRRTMPTYSEAFKATSDWFRGTAGRIVAPFITFTTEMIRVTAGSFKQATEEVMDSNPKIKMIGVQRFVGLAVAATALQGIGIAAKAALGYDDDDEEAVRRGLPPWQKNAQIMFWGKKGSNGNKHNFIDLSYLNPYNYFTDPFIALMRGIHEDKPGEGVIQAGIELAKPFFGEQLFMGMVYDQLRNQKADGGKIFNPADDRLTQTKKRIAYADKLMPGFWTSANRIRKAAMGTVERGRSYNLLAEVAAPLTGQRIQEYDPENSFMYQTGRFNKDRQNASQLFNEIFGSTSTVSKGDVAKAYNSANASHKLALSELQKDFKAAVKLGVVEKQAKKIMEGNRVGKDSISAVRKDKYHRWEPGTILDKVKKEHPERYREFMDAFSKAKKTEALK